MSAQELVNVLATEIDKFEAGSSMRVSHLSIDALTRDIHVTVEHVVLAKIRS